MAPKTLGEFVRALKKDDKRRRKLRRMLDKAKNRWIKHLSCFNNCRKWPKTRRQLNPALPGEVKIYCIGEKTGRGVQKNIGKTLQMPRKTWYRATREVRGWSEAEATTVKQRDQATTLWRHIYQTQFSCPFGYVSCLYILKTSASSFRRPDRISISEISSTFDWTFSLLFSNLVSEFAIRS